MPLITAQNLMAGFSDKILFSNANFSIEKNDRIGLIGANGSGKTTLFRLILREIEPTDGSLILSTQIRIGCVEQHACRDLSKTAYEEVLTVYQDVMDMERELEEITQKLAKGNMDPSLLERQETVRENFEARDGMSYQSRARSALTGLGFTIEETNQKIQTLSGGQRTKISLAKLLLSGADLILLDEPTNHLDISSVEWLEDFLRKYNGAALIISHDRFFLDKTTEKTMEIEGGRLFFTKGNYSFYHQLKEERVKTEMRENEAIEKEIKRIESMIEMQKRFNRERNYITIASKEKQIERLKAGLHESVYKKQEMKLRFPLQNESGNDVLFAENLSKSFKGRPLFSHVSLNVYKGERVFLLGANGCGKTTLLKIIMGLLPPDSGRLRFGTGVRIGYFEQTQHALQVEKTVLQEVYDAFPTKSIPELRGILAAFLFRGDAIEKQMNELSGGERAKVALMEIMLRGCNLLILDEPTNHLDIASREVLEEALEAYEGTLIAVSHDRYFVNRLASKIYCFDGGTLKKIDGNYDSWLEFRENKTKDNVESQKIKKPNEYQQKKEAARAKRQRSTRISKLETQIAELEEQKNLLQAQISSPEFVSDYQKITELTEKLSELNENQDEIYTEWLDLMEEDSEDS